LYELTTYWFRKYRQVDASEDDDEDDTIMSMEDESGAVPANTRSAPFNAILYSNSIHLNQMLNHKSTRSRPLKLRLNDLLSTLTPPPIITNDEDDESDDYHHKEQQGYHHHSQQMTPAPSNHNCNYKSNRVGSCDLDFEYYTHKEEIEFHHQRKELQRRSRWHSSSTFSKQNQRRDTTVVKRLEPEGDIAACDVMRKSSSYQRLTTAHDYADAA